MGKERRRSKKSSAADPSAKGNAGDTSAKNENISLEEQIQRAETAVRNNEFKVQTLHKQWKTYLLRLSYMVIMIAFHQMQNPSTACLKDVKAFNAVLKAEAQAEGQEEEDHSALQGDLISGWQVFLLVMSDCMVHVLAIVMGCLLSFFLQAQTTPTLRTMALQNHLQPLFSNPRYMLANACIPPMLGLHFGRNDNKQLWFVALLWPQSAAEDDDTASLSNLYSGSCLDASLLERAGVEPEERQRTLPVVLVFHVICTACIWFMDMQQRQVATNLKRVAVLRQELVSAQQHHQQQQQQQAQQKSSQTMTKQQQQQAQPSPTTKTAPAENNDDDNNNNKGDKKKQQ